MTKDERFLIEIFKKANEAGDPFCAVDPMQVAQHIGFSPRQAGTILRGLCQANFLKKQGDRVHLTPRGEELVRSLI